MRKDTIDEFKEWISAAYNKMFRDYPNMGVDHKRLMVEKEATLIDKSKGKDIVQSAEKSAAAEMRQ